MKKLIVLLIMLSCSSISAKHAPLETVSYVDIDRYLGKWYEIARFDQKFQRGCTAVTAEYAKRPDGDIMVLNSCRLKHPQGRLKSAVGRAWVKDENTNAKLKVQFFLRAIRLPIFSGNYWILELDADYKYALVGDKSRKYLWILSRDKNMSKETYNYLVQVAKDKHFDVSKLMKTRH